MLGDPHIVFFSKIWEGVCVAPMQEGKGEKNKTRVAFPLLPGGFPLNDVSAVTIKGIRDRDFAGHFSVHVPNSNSIKYSSYLRVTLPRHQKSAFAKYLNIWTAAFPEESEPEKAEPELKVTV